MDFGTLTHSTLESLSDLGNETQEEEEIYQCMVARLEKEFSYRFGRSPSLSILQQKASIERRLRRVAQLHRQDLLNGWQVDRVEAKFHLDTRGSLDPGEWKVLADKDEPVEGENSIRIVGVVDRIDFHPELGVYRLLDYKTSEKGPKELHLKKSNLRMEEYPEYFFFEQNENSTAYFMITSLLNLFETAITSEVILKYCGILILLVSICAIVYQHAISKQLMYD